ncbi:hypothetical protein kam1_1664 [Methylacidiphilum kamchatkense Kam1]|uniref:Uncharacterized protein n=1 Tax=Methylacidiphilum kamchatkense Kam1 TaxID=1202785 RepID=A0A516TNR8_9BACT|nr:hypothetical protein kam1_1664 [Methylacidiphilum kamchatkense Kam1]
MSFMDKKTSLLIFFSIISPATGFLVEMLLGWKFGISSVVDGYRTALLFFRYKDLSLLFFLPSFLLFLRKYRRKKVTDVRLSPLLLILLLYVLFQLCL